MQLPFPLHVLLATFLFTISLNAAPVKRNTGVTLPLKRVERSQSNLHPQIYLQQNINRSLRRLARMTGRDEPCEKDLAQALHKRVLALEGSEGLQKRFNREGLPTVPDVAKPVGQALSGAASVLASGEGKKHQQGKGESAGAGAADAGAGAAGIGAGAAAGSSNSAALDTVTNANPPSDANSLGLDIESQDVGYLATVQLGTPPRDFLILMDSGSADFWVGAENCQSQAGGGCGNHKFLGPASSSTFQDTQKPFSVTYGTGNVQGDIITDNVAIAGLALPAHTFGVATSESVDFSGDGTPFDGLMGLAQSTLSEQQTDTPVESLAAANLIPEPIVSYKISRLADNKNDGEITFGSLDQSKFDANTQVTIPNVNTQGFWEGAMDSVTVDGQDTGLQGRTSILDTGTTLIVAPASDAAAVHKLIPGSQSDGQGGFTVPCTTNASVALSFGGTSFAIDSRDIAIQPVDANDPTGDCVSGISSGNIGGATEWLVGDVFLKNAYFSTNVQKNTVSLAKLV